MNKQNIFFLIGLLLSFKVADSANLASLYDVVDEAKSQLESLHSIILGSIQDAQINLDVFYTDMLTYSFTVLNNGNISIDIVHSRVSQELQQIKDLALQANTDISYCMEGREERIHSLPEEHIDHISICVAEQVDIGVLLVESESYLVDILMTRVLHLEFQVMVCGASVQCLTPVLNQIQRDIIELPLHIKEEVKESEELIGKMRVIMKECYDNNLADFTGTVTELVKQISTCASDIIGKK